MNVRTSTIATRVALLIVSLALVAACRTTKPPQLILEAVVAPDLAALASDTWAAFVDAYAGRIDCFGDVSLHTAETLDGRAVYDPETATVTVEVPATAVLLQAALVHEWAHHVEHQCDAHTELRPAFLAAMSMPDDADWFAAATWAETPSEQHAEAAIILVLGRRQLPTEASVSPEAVDALAQWASGE